MKKILAILFILTLFINKVHAKSFYNPISSAIKKADISKSALIAVSFKEITTGKKAFELNPNVPMSPASIQKIITLLPSLDILGKDYEFKTQLYKNNKNEVYLKLGADPYLISKELREMIRNFDKYKLNSPKAFYIDDSILDANEWGEGWQWDDDLNPLITKFGAYNLDRNLITVNISPTQFGAPAEMSTSVFYPTSFMNNVKTGNINDIKLERKNYISPDIINADGVISKEMNIEIPINYPRRYFILRLEEILRKQKISYYGNFNRLKLPKTIYMIAEVKHPLSSAVDDILKNSNNMMAETVFKLAGGKYKNNTGSQEAAIEMLNEYYKKLGINTENIKIVDGSGVSKNNLISADFMTDVLLKEAQNKDFNYIKQYMPTPGEGTLMNRMLYFKDNLNAKTGTLSNISSIAGYLTTKSGKNYAFCIMVNDSKSKSADKKSFEEYVLREAFSSL
jgi:D-alanyl-D-alanine carboxypeptidase/D-alanyl-D-alanine-endopeptidase (penicillin-binding protein 4)